MISLTWFCYKNWQTIHVREHVGKLKKKSDNTKNLLNHVLDKFEKKEKIVCK